jgi:hypothetical protein
MRSLQTLDELGIRRVTDKSSLAHDYLRKYQRLFAPFRDAPITLMEIGVLDGGSLRLWEDYFPLATVVGLDIHAACKQYEGGRRVVEIASQADAKALTAIGQKYRPQIIIDDGSHQADHILTSFQALYPFLCEGGIYIVEDLGMHAGAIAARFRGSALTSPQQYFLRLANRVACPAEELEFDTKILWATEAVEFFNGVSVIKKKSSPEPDRVENRRPLVHQLDSHPTWGWFSSYLRRNGGSKEEAIECAKRAIAMDPLGWVHYMELCQALEWAGRLEEALLAAKDALRCSPNHLGLLDLVAGLAAKVESQGTVLRPS